MSSKRSKILIPLSVVIVGIILIAAIVGTKPPQTEKKEFDTRPIVKVEPVKAEPHQVVINGYGELQPIEKTLVSAQVSGEVLKWHPNFVVGGLVKRGDVLFQIERDNYEVALLQAESQLKQAKAALIEEQGRAEVAKREAKRMPNERVSDLYLRKPQVMSAEAAVKLAQANVKLAKRDLDNCTVVAPYDALIVRRDVGTGQFVNRGTTVGELYNIERAQVIFPIAGFDRTFLPNKLMGMDATVSTQDKFSVSRSGIIVRDTGIVDQNTRMGHVVVEIDDPYGLKQDMPRLLFGAYVQVSFNGQYLDSVVKVSQDLVSNNKVWILEDDNTIAQKTVNVVKEEGKTFLIGGGLATDDKLVLTIPEYAQNGMKVKLESDVKKENDQEEPNANVISSSVAQSK